MNMHTYKGGFRRRDTARGHPSNPPPLSLFNGRWASKRIKMEGHFTPGSLVSCVMHNA